MPAPMECATKGKNCQTADKCHRAGGQGQGDTYHIHLLGGVSGLLVFRFCLGYDTMGCVLSMSHCTVDGERLGAQRTLLGTRRTLTLVLASR